MTTQTLGNKELVNLYGETCYELGFYASERKHDFASAILARNQMREDLLVRLDAMTEEGPQQEQVFSPERIQKGPLTDEDVLLSLIPTISRLARKIGKTSKAERNDLFTVIQELNSQLRPCGWEYVLRPGMIVTLRHPIKQYTWPDETRG